jgi:hypothetical protein
MKAYFGSQSFVRFLLTLSEISDIFKQIIGGNPPAAAAGVLRALPAAEKHPLNLIRLVPS